MKFPQQDVDALVATIEGAGKTIEQQAGDELAATAIYDHAWFDRVSTTLGQDKALELHKKMWLMRVTDSVNEGKLDLNVAAIDTIPTLGMMAKAAFERRGCIVEVNEIRLDCFSADVTLDPLFELAAPLNGEDVGGAYMNSFAAILEAAIPQMAAESSLANQVDAKLTSNMFAGEGKTSFTFSKKAGC